MDPVTIAMTLASAYAPQALKWLGLGPKSTAVAAKVIEIASDVTGFPDPLKAAAAITADPTMANNFKQAMLDNDLEMERLATQNATDVNATMRAEAKAERWPTYSWRPAIGFAVALDITICALTIAAAYIAAMVTGQTKHLEYLPGMLAAMTGLVAVVSPILGITAYYRGRMQAAQK